MLGAAWLGGINLFCDPRRVFFLWYDHNKIHCTCKCIGYEILSGVLDTPRLETMSSLPLRFATISLPGSLKLRNRKMHRIKDVIRRDDSDGDGIEDEDDSGDEDESTTSTTVASTKKTKAPTSPGLSTPQTITSSVLFNTGSSNPSTV